VSAEAVAFALGAAVVHALWNLLLAGSRDPRAAGAVALAIGAVLALPFALLRWQVDSAALPWIAISIVFELGYFMLLTRAYDLSELDVVYPVARGSAPVLVLVVGGAPSAAAAAGVLAVAVGVLAVRGVARPRDARELVYALGVGAMIAGYTLADSHGVKHADAVTYLELVLAPTALVMLLVESRSRALRPQVNARNAVSGAGMMLAYGLVLAALSLASAAAVAALRETSVVIAALLAAVAARRAPDRGRLAGAVLVTVGVAVIALS
jgi:uncharacterized membrane protein